MWPWVAGVERCEVRFWGAGRLGERGFRAKWCNRDTGFASHPHGELDPWEAQTCWRWCMHAFGVTFSATHLPRRSHLCICQAEGGRHSLLPSPPHLLGSLPPLLLLSRAFYHMATVTTWPRASLLSQNTARTQMGNLLICTY